MQPPRERFVECQHFAQQRIEVEFLPRGFRHARVLTERVDHVFKRADLVDDGLSRALQHVRIHGSQFVRKLVLQPLGR